MKKLTILLVTLLTLMLPVGIAAEEVEVNNDSNIDLYANIESSYMVKLPRSVDVSANSVDVVIKAKGDIAADKQLNITATDSLQLADSKGRASVTVNVTKQGSPFLYDTLPAEYTDTAKVTFTLTHQTLAAGAYTGILPITISLENKAS